MLLEQGMIALSGFVFHGHQTGAKEAPTRKAKQLISPGLGKWDGRPPHILLRHSAVENGWHVLHDNTLALPSIDHEDSFSSPGTRGNEPDLDQVSSLTERAGGTYEWHKALLEAIWPTQKVETISKVLILLGRTHLKPIFTETCGAASAFIRLDGIGWTMHNDRVGPNFIGGWRMPWCSTRNETRSSSPTKESTKCLSETTIISRRGTRTAVAREVTTMLLFVEQFRLAVFGPRYLLSI